MGVSDPEYDVALFTKLREQVRDGRLHPDRCRFRVAPGAEGTAIELGHSIAWREGQMRTEQGPGSNAERERLEAEAVASLAAGELAVIILNGGMATRFGGGVAKGTVDLGTASPSSFLGWHLQHVADLQRERDLRVPVAIMHSFATRRASEEHLASIAWGGLEPETCLSFEQAAWPRLLPDGSVLAQSGWATACADPRAGFAAAGHGDLPRALVQSGVASQLRARGVAHVLICNVDNLGATVDPHIYGRHLRAHARGSGVTVEVVQREQGEGGGCIGQISGRPVIVEGFRLPESTSLADYPLFNTNTLWVALDGLEPSLPLDWFPVARSLELEGQAVPILQLERLIGQITEFVPSTFIHVDRGQRFMPVKSRDDLVARRSFIESWQSRADSRV